MGLPLTRLKFHHLTTCLDRFLARPLVRFVVFAAVFLWVWLFLTSGVAHAY